MAHMRDMWMSTRRRRPRTRIHTPQARPALDRWLQHRPPTRTNKLLKHSPRTGPTRPLVIVVRAAVVAAREDTTAGQVTLVQWVVKVELWGVAPSGRLGAALEERERAADASALVPPTGAERLAGLVAEDDGAREDATIGGWLFLFLLLREDGFTAGRLVLCSAATTGALNLFGAWRTRVPVAGRLAEVATWEGLGARGSAGGKG